MKCGYHENLFLIGKVKTNLEDLREWCQDRIPDLTVDRSNYTDNRYNLWLFNRCDLRNGNITKGYFDDRNRIWEFSQRIYPGCNIGLLSVHNNFSNGRIRPHRDHRYAKPIARGVNLGSCVFGYGDKEHKHYKLNDGDIIEFNCKVLHSVPKILTAERFSLVFWQLNESKGFQSVM
ncbi:hypothetical protein [Aerosakkonema sp. BLCC-F183]|uniref:hypothetical protein n=1 Tax=Aerosakkonema sp. BLCC-F183 TaxID=3342834 RepID=UPI0035BC7F34